MKGSGQTVNINVRFPSDLHVRLAAAAKAHGISLNKQILDALELGLNTGDQLDDTVARLLPSLGPLIQQAIQDQNARRS